MKFEEIPIGDLVEKPATWNPKNCVSDTFEYIDLSSVDKDEKVITIVKRYLCREAPSRARQLVKENDVLVATVRPNLNGVAMVSAEHDGMTASTGYCILRPIPGRLDSGFLFHWVKTGVFVQRMVDVATGASYPAVSDAKVKASNIPLPPLTEQKRIAGILDVADTLRIKRREALAQLNTFLQSTFLDMFGDPVTNPMGWETYRVANFCTTGTGGTPSRKKARRYYEGGTIPWVKSGELREGVITSTDEHITEAALRETNVKLVPKNSLLLALYGATVGRLGVLGVEATTNQAVCHVIPNPARANRQYMFHSLTNQVSYLVSRGVGGAQPNISQGIVRSLQIPLPPLDLQHRFADIVKSIEQQKARMRVHLAELDALFASLQSRAFSGEL